MLYNILIINILWEIKVDITVMKTNLIILESN